MEREPTIRFELSLEPGPSGYAEYSYKNLLKEAVRRSNENDANSSLNQSVSSTNSSIVDLVNRGSGYDQGDSLVDDTEPYDEFIKKSDISYIGGFHINYGKINFKRPLSPTAPDANVKRRKIVGKSQGSKTKETNKKLIVSPSKVEKIITQVPGSVSIGEKLARDAVDPAKDGHPLSEEHSVRVSAVAQNYDALRLVLNLPPDMFAMLQGLFETLKSTVDCMTEKKQRNLFASNPDVMQALLQVDSMTKGMTQVQKKVVYQHLSSILHYSVRTLKDKVKKLQTLENPRVFRIEKPEFVPKERPEITTKERLEELLKRRPEISLKDSPGNFLKEKSENPGTVLKEKLEIVPMGEFEYVPDKDIETVEIFSDEEVQIIEVIPKGHG